ncbi:neutral ceramidase-like [Pectinophora gossypiella]|uniref:neutral ceramidase-like n=1 Tax=Pectinophora gossypiella TaxID=13191 RepID=UPI00214EEC7E|nr:neutral ceramidase-like [Pectinophora gossypiella]
MGLSTCAKPSGPPGSAHAITPSPNRTITNFKKGKEYLVRLFFNFQSIVRAHENMVPAQLFYGTTRVWNAHMNRSPYSYEYNPPEERMRFDQNTDNTLTQVRIVKENGDLHGVLNWFSVHTVSMNMTNTLISSDNLGYAALMMEKTLNPTSMTGKPEIVAGFFASSLGDVSPNTRGARCEFSGEECDNQFLLCEAQERCYSLGPGDDMFESTKIIGTAVYEGAMEVLSSPGEELKGELAVVHQFVEMPLQTVSRYDPIARTFNADEPVSGCVPAMGYSFASGTIDGANTLNITQGTVQGNDLLDTISGVIAEPTQEDEECHAPKPILLMTGRANFPIPWHPRTISVSLIWLADFVIAGVPGEPTTMTGRRIKDVIGSVMENHGFEPKVAVSSLSNEYIHYVCTYEEYQVQRYEAASTIYGPHTLDIFLNKFSEFTTVAIEGGDVEPGTEPADNRNGTLSLILPVVMDNAPLGRSFGDVLEQPPETVRRGQTITATFVAANPRNDLRQESSHAVVERFELGQWIVVATDADWETKFHWVRQSTITGTSRATFEWTIPSDAIFAPHRIVYYGASRSLLGTVNQFEGVTNSFNIVQ